MEIRFSAPRDISRPGDDGRTYAFPCIAIRHGGEHELPVTSDHRIDVLLVDSLVKRWQYSENELPRVLFQFAMDRVRQLVQGGSLPVQVKIPLSTFTAPLDKPYDPATLPDPDGYVLQIGHKPPTGSP